VPEAALERDGEAPWVSVAIDDDGPGMTRAEIEEALDPVSTLQLGERSGLGFPIVQDLVARLRGVVVVRSAPGRGTAVELLMPVATGARDT
jgi:signal transduction histidine kinase